MKAETFLRARCLYSKLSEFATNHLYSFGLLYRLTSYDVYVSEREIYAFRFLGDSTRALLIEDVNGVIAVFEIILECTV